MTDSSMTGAGWWDTNTDSSPLTAEAFWKAVEQVEAAQQEVCGVTHPHLVHPKAEGSTSSTDRQLALPPGGDDG